MTVWKWLFLWRLLQEKQMCDIQNVRAMTRTKYPNVDSNVNVPETSWYFRLELVVHSQTRGDIDCIKGINLSFPCPTCCLPVNAFLIPGGTPCIQMNCKQDIESIASEAARYRGWRGVKAGGRNKNKCEGDTMRVTERRTSDTAETLRGSCKGEEGYNKRRRIGRVIKARWSK